MWRSSDLPMTMFEADRLHRIVAPAIAPSEDGGVGAQKSSQISAKKRKFGSTSLAKTRSTPNGTSCPLTAMVAPRMALPLANQRFS